MLLMHMALFTYIENMEYLLLLLVVSFVFQFILFDCIFTIPYTVLIVQCKEKDCERCYITELKKSGTTDTKKNNQS